MVAKGIKAAGTVHWNLGPKAFLEAAVRRNEGRAVRAGPFVANTTPHTGRSPKDKFVVREPATEADIWWGPVNQEIDAGAYRRLDEAVRAYLSARDELFVRDLFAGADPSYRIPVRFVTTHAWNGLFVWNMFIRPTVDMLDNFQPEFTVLHAPEMQIDAAEFGTRTGTFIVVNFGERTVLIGGTRYAGEMKKSMFTILNYLYPQRGVLPMHCSANKGEAGDVALFFGLSGTGKTTLSADSSRGLIGDDEHGWSDTGVFNFEGGCYAKVIRLSAEGEPEIYATTKMEGTILENVVVDDAGMIDLNDDSITENTRASYPIHYIPNHVGDGVGGHPRNVVFLTADAFGVLPPVAKLTAEQAMYHFLSGYTAKVAGTERGVTEPQATFSACFGAPFLPLHPSVYANMLGERIERHNAKCWLVNTGWTGGAYGTGHRMSLSHTRAMVRAVLSGSLDKTPTRPHPVFGIHVPREIPGVPSDVLDPRSTWADPSAYDQQAAKLATMFRDRSRPLRGHPRSSME